MSTSTDSVASTLANLGVLQKPATTTTTNATGAGGLTQSDFLTLLTAQLKNQSPLNPADTSQFASEMAQLGAVGGIQQLNTTMQSLSTSLLSNQALQASSLVGQSVAVSNNNTVVLDGSTQGAVGSLTLTQPTNNIIVTIKDSGGNVINTIPMGSGSAGNLNFSWDGTESNGQAAPAPAAYQVTATGQINGKSTDLNVAAATKVTSIIVGSNGGGMELNLENGSQTSLNNVVQIF